MSGECLPAFPQRSEQWQQTRETRSPVPASSSPLWKCTARRLCPSSKGFSCSDALLLQFYSQWNCHCWNGVLRRGYERHPSRTARTTAQHRHRMEERSANHWVPRRVCRTGTVSNVLTESSHALLISAADGGGAAPGDPKAKYVAAARVTVASHWLVLKRCTAGQHPLVGLVSQVAAAIS